MKFWLALLDHDNCGYTESLLISLIQNSFDMKSSPKIDTWKWEPILGTQNTLRGQDVIGDIKLTGITFRYFSSHVFVYAKGGWMALWKGA